jgi:chromosome segregation ATPase
MRYEYDKIPISEETKKGMTLNINDLGAIGRMLAMQDAAYDEQFEALTEMNKVVKDSLDVILSQVRSMAVTINEVKAAMKAMKKDVNVLKQEFNAIKNEVADINVRLSEVECEVLKIKEKQGLQAS